MIFQSCRVADTVRALRPDVIVNAAAHTAVDKAESEPEFRAPAQRHHARRAGRRSGPPGRLAGALQHRLCVRRQRHRPWVETTPAPLSCYGRTKLEGEQRIQQSGCKHLILRTSWVYAARGGNFAKTMLRLAQERDRLTVIDDQWGALQVPTCWPTSRPTPSGTWRNAPGRRPVPLRGSGRDQLEFVCKEVLALAAQAQPAIKLQKQLTSPRAHQCLPHARSAAAQLAPEHGPPASHLRPAAAALARWGGAHAHRNPLKHPDHDSGTQRGPQRHHPRRGSGTRLHPATLAISKQLLPVYDKPMIYYPLSTLMLAGIRDILVISTPQDTPALRNCWVTAASGASTCNTPCSPARMAWRRPSSSASQFLGDSPSALVLGDNIFHGHDFHELLDSAPSAPTAPACLPTMCTTPSATAWPSSIPRARCFRSKKTGFAQIQLCGHRSVLL